ncbi:unnamed protein product [Mycena citricolor]|uniref:DUF6570 domain-containing protein n=1 Tax=Mycena citricolor TaxID=2018698 RepID=A0AAD2H8Q3_9AGAR|nr:unnamed protein product [Mycena citricolor]
MAAHTDVGPVSPLAHLTVPQILSLAQEGIDNPTRFPRCKAELVAFIESNVPPVRLRDIHAAAANILAERGAANLRSLKRKREEREDLARHARMRATEIQALPAGIGGSIEKKDISQFMALPDEDRRRLLYRRFYLATSNKGVATMVCAVCGREIDINDKEEATPRRLQTLPNPHCLAPASPHPAHDLYHGMLLDPAGVLQRGEEAFVHVCAHCYCSLVANDNRPPKFALANNLWLGPVPWQLQKLTFPEQLLIALVYPRVFVFKLHPRVGGRDPTKLQRGMRGTVSSYELDTVKC